MVMREKYNSVEIGKLYMHELHPAIYRCTSVTKNRVTLEYVWNVPGYNGDLIPISFGVATKKTINLVLRYDGTLYGWIPIDVAWFGRVWRELTDLIQNEFGDKGE
jgi:hypothetical protein